MKSAHNQLKTNQYFFKRKKIKQMKSSLSSQFYEEIVQELYHRDLRQYASRRRGEAEPRRRPFRPQLFTNVRQWWNIAKEFLP
jgi:hypothetical protein